MDAAVKRVQETAVDPVRECSAADAERRQLRRRHDAVLPGRDPTDQQIHVHNCRIETLLRNRRQNYMAYMQLCRHDEASGATAPHHRAAHRPEPRG